MLSQALVRRWCAVALWRHVAHGPLASLLQHSMRGRDAGLLQVLLRLLSPLRTLQVKLHRLCCMQELQHVKHTLIGEDVDGAVSGISGGERRRVSVGIGLVTDAHSIFLDEPTTGLDSDSAEALISLLSHLAVVKRRTARPRP